MSFGSFGHRPVGYEIPLPVRGYLISFVEKNNTVYIEYGLQGQRTGAGGLAGAGTLRRLAAVADGAREKLSGRPEGRRKEQSEWKERELHGVRVGMDI